MSNIAWLFNLHDSDKDGFLTKDEVLQLSESLLVSVSLSRRLFININVRAPIVHLPKRARGSLFRGSFECTSQRHGLDTIS